MRWCVPTLDAVIDTLCQTPAAVTGLSGTVTGLLSDAIHFLFMVEKDGRAEGGGGREEDGGEER